MLQSNLNSRTLDQFYTNENVAKQCIALLLSYLASKKIDLWIEPSAGTGAFFSQFT